MESKVKDLIALITDHGESNISERKPATLYAPRNYMMGLGGKKLRSLLCLLGYELYRSDVESALDLAYAIELFHNFTLVHDDIMDAATTRRGQEAVHIKYDVNSAILTGDVMLIEVYDRLARFDPSPPLLMQRFTQIAREVCEGQSLDMQFETDDAVSIQQYLHMIELKTAVLIGFSLEAGAWLAGAPEKDRQHLYQFGVNAGIAFQLQDDFLDLYGDSDAVGKKVGGDILQGKKTYLYLRAAELLEEPDLVSFLALYKSRDPEKVSKVKRIFDDLYISHYCGEAKRSFFDLAISHMAAVKADEQKKKFLVEFSRGLFERDK